jgi:hypothetical protein
MTIKYWKTNNENKLDFIHNDFNFELNIYYGDILTKKYGKKGNKVSSVIFHYSDSPSS